MDLLSHVIEIAPLAIDDLEEFISREGCSVVAIERHDKHRLEWSHNAKDKYVWVKGRSKTTVAKVRDAYLKLYQTQEPEILVNLKIDDWTPPLNKRMSDLSTGCYVVFTAVAETSGRIQDGPLLPTSATPSTSYGSVMAEPIAQATSRSPTETQPRQPLGPVHRQLNFPLKPSFDTSECVKFEHDEAVPSVVERPGKLAKQPGTTSAVSYEHNAGVQSGPLLSNTVPSAHRNYSGHSPVKVWEDGSSATIKITPNAASPARTDAQNRFTSDTIEPDRSPQKEQQRHARGQSIKDFANHTTPERLEAGVRAGIRALSELKASLRQLGGSADSQAWLDQIETVRGLSVKSRTVVGVVGNTGAGKSSVINAILDEERLVPTNCMRACTAVVTEMSYNDSRSESSKYRAEIEFIQPDDWRKELEILVDEVFDDNGKIIRDTGNPESQAGIAYAKIRAVYHRHTRDMLANATVESLMNARSVKAVLGKTRRIDERDPVAFYNRLQSYVDSKDKDTGKSDKNGSKRKRNFEYWPLIKVVKIYTKAEALSTGAVVVDLPGVHDSNAARAAVAESYIKQCTGLWIVAPITRAVDDKAAKNLLGNTFKRQLKYDGTYSAVTFICSKTDDISVTEAADSLQLGDTFAELGDQLTEIDRKRTELRKQQTDLKTEKVGLSAVLEDLDDSIEKWEELQAKFESGEKVYSPLTPSKKRKRGSKRSLSERKNRRLSNDDERSWTISSSEDDISNDDISDDQRIDNSGRNPLSNEDIDGKLGELKKLKKDARRKKNDIEDQMRELRKQTSPLDDEVARIDAQQYALCISGRNEYSRNAIRTDFAAGIKELDQENAEENDPDNFNPDEDARDYDEVARSLPVYCVSSRAYQKLSGRLQKDNDVPGFAEIEQTEIPQLQVHCKKITESTRKASSRRFLNSFTQLLTSLSLWSSDDGTSAISTQQRDTEKDFLARNLEELERALQKCVSDTMESVVETLGEHIFDKFKPAGQVAATKAIPTSAKWGTDRKQGGLHYSTYKATVRRHGCYSSATAGLRDMNAELTEPVYQHLASSWEKAFHRRLPHILQGFTKSASKSVKKFHEAVKSRCQQKGLGLAQIGMLENQLKAYQSLLADLATSMVAQVNEGQREINREFTPVIAQAMTPAYGACTDERGTGSFKRMKEHMAQHVSANHLSMFEDASRQVHSSLLKMCNDVSKKMLDQAANVYVRMQRDYMSIVGQGSTSTQLVRHEGALKRAIDADIGRFDAYFQDALETDLVDLDAADEPENNVTDDFAVGIPYDEPEEIADFDDALEPEREGESEGDGNENDFSDDVEH